MKHSAKKFLALLVVSGLIVAALSGVAARLPTLVRRLRHLVGQTNYGVTESEVATVADGFPDGTFRPASRSPEASSPRWRSAAWESPRLDPATATFKDVIPSNTALRLRRGRLRG